MAGVNTIPFPASSENPDEQIFDELLAKYTAAIFTAKELESLDIPTRQTLMGNWMREGDLGFVFGERGSGKTWFVDAIATHLSVGRQLSDWAVPAPIDVLLIGEMPLDAARDRLKGMSPNNSRLHVLHHEMLFDKSGIAMNLTSANVQKVVTDICIGKSIKLLVIDNLSCLFRGLRRTMPTSGRRS
jgi:hypothetical protein